MQWKKMGYVLTTEAWPFWLLVGANLFAWFVSYSAASNCTEQILYSGTLFQLCGLATVAYGIRDLRKQFGKPSTMGRFAVWLESLKVALGKPLSAHAVVGSSSAVCSLGSVSASGTIGGLTVDQRVEALEKALSDMRIEQEKRFRDLDGSVSRVEGLIQVEGENRQNGDVELLRKLEEVAVGGLQLEVVGFVLLLVGMLGTSVPKEIAKLVPNALII